MFNCGPGSVSQAGFQRDISNAPQPVGPEAAREEGCHSPVEAAASDYGTGMVFQAYSLQNYYGSMFPSYMTAY